jgi:hypothetical protein
MSKKNFASLTTITAVTLAPLVSLFSLHQTFAGLIPEDPSRAFVAGITLGFPAILLQTSILGGDE